MSRAGTILRLRDVRQRVPLGRTTIYRKMGKGTFPPQVPIAVADDGTHTAVGWYEREIDAYVANPADWRGELARREAEA